MKSGEVGSLTCCWKSHGGVIVELVHGYGGVCVVDAGIIELWEGGFPS